MAIDTKKLLPHSAKANEVSDKDVEQVGIVASKLIDINTLMKGSLVLEKMRAKKEKKAKEKKKRNMKEKMREGLKNVGKGVVDKVKKVGGSMMDWLNKLIFGMVLIGLFKIYDFIKPILPVIAKIVDVAIAVAGWVFNIASTLIHWMYQFVDVIRGFIKNIFGEGGLKIFDNLMGALNTVLNALLMAVMVLWKPIKALVRFKDVLINRIKSLWKMAKRIPGVDKAMRWGKAKVGRLIGRGGRQFFRKVGKQGLRKTLMQSGKQGVKKATGLVVKWFGPKIANVVQPLFRNIMRSPATKALRKIPVLGPIIVGVFSVLAGDPLGKTMFKVLGAALGGMLGTAAGTAITAAIGTVTAGIGAVLVPLILPACTILGEMIGVWIGDLLYNLFFGGGLGKLGKSLTNGLKEAFKKILDIPKWIANFLTSGIKNFIEDFPTLPIPDINPGSIFAGIIEKIPGGKKLLNFTVPGWMPFIGGLGIGSILEGLPGLQEVLGFFAQAVPGLNSYVEDGKLTKIPNLLLLGAPFLLIPHFMRSFFGGGDKGENPKGKIKKIEGKGDKGKKKDKGLNQKKLISYLKFKSEEKHAKEEQKKKEAAALKEKQKTDLTKKIETFMSRSLDGGSPVSKDGAEDKSESLNQYPSYDSKSQQGQTAMVPLPSKVLPGAEDTSSSVGGVSSGGGQDPFEAFYAHPGGLV